MMKTQGKQQTTIAIVGGGVSGALTAYHLTRQGTDARVVVIDPRKDLGLGLAYSTPSLRHLLNVPAGKISALPGEPDHFLNWLRAHDDAEATEKTFAPRAVFGQYVQSLMAGAQEIEHVRATAVGYRPAGAGAVVVLDDGCELMADGVVLATGNFDPAPLPVDAQAIESGAYHHNAWVEETYAGLEPDAAVTVIGTGLTAVDVVLRLRELGHRGTVTAASRHGAFPYPHADYVPLPESAVPRETAPTCVAYLRALRKAIREGAEWRAAIDSLRATTNDLWRALPLGEQERFRRHLQWRWVLVRHRMAPQIAAVIQRELAAGTLGIREGSLESVEVAAGGATVTIRKGAATESFEATRVINCTGPSMNYRRVSSPLLESLFAQGLVSPGPMGGGFDCTRTGALIGADGAASEVLFNVGQGRWGTLLESIAIPEIREQASELAEMLVAEKVCIGVSA